MKRKHSFCGKHFGEKVSRFWMKKTTDNQKTGTIHQLSNQKYEVTPNGNWVKVR